MRIRLHASVYSLTIMKKVHFLLLVLVTSEIYPRVDTVAVKSSLPRPSAGNYTCNVIMPTFWSITDRAAPMKMLFSSLVERIRGLNCSVTSEELIDLGKPNDTGQYDQAIGMIQRNEVTGVIFPARPDSLPFEPAIIGSVWGSADASMLTRKKPRYQIVRDVMSVFIDIGGLMYVYTFYVLIICTVIMVLSRVLNRSTQPYWLLTVKAFHDIFWVLLCIQQPSLDNSSPSTKVLITSMSLFAFSFIIGFLQNRVGSDLCILFGDRDIDSIDDLLEQDSVSPWLSPRLYLYNILKAAPVGTKTHVLWQRIMQNANWSMEKVTRQESFADSALPTFIDLFKRTSDGQVAILIAAPFAKTCRDVACIFRYNFAVNTTIARQTFANGYLAAIWSHLTDKSYLRSLNLVFSNMFEGHLLLGAVATTRLNSPAPEFAVAEARTIACQDGLVDEEVDWYPFNLFLFKGTFGFLLSGVACSFILYFCEKIHRRLHQLTSGTTYSGSRKFV